MSPKRSRRFFPAIRTQLDPIRHTNRPPINRVPSRNDKEELFIRDGSKSGVESKCREEKSSAE